VRPVDAFVGSRIRVDWRLDISAWARENLQLTNPAYKRAEREFVRLGEIPREIKLYEETTMWIDLPRGCLSDLLTEFPDVNLIDRRSSGFKIDTRAWVHPTMRTYQQKALNNIVAENGVYEAPPGAGKTIVILEAIRRLERKAIVIVNRAALADQWAQRAEEHFGIPVGIIGDGVWDEQDVTIAMQQSLWSRIDDLNRTNFWEAWGFVCLDETHHASARTFYDVLDRFPALHRVGVSATPVKDPELEPFIRGILGPTIHETTPEELVAAGVGVKPRVVIAETSFKHSFWPTHRPYDKKKAQKTGRSCQWEPHCNRRGKVHRNNYQQVMDDLVADEKRNSLIADCIVDSINPATQLDPRVCIVLSKRLSHLDELCRLVTIKYTSLWTFPPSVEFLTGREDQSKRELVMKRVESDARGLVIFSTIADEGLDIPRLDAIFLAYPGRNVKTLQQQVGRIERGHPDKGDPMIVDFSDQVGILQSQLEDRIGFYESRDFEIDIVPRSE